MEHVLGHAEIASHTNVTVMICLKENAVPKDSVLNNERGLVWQSKCTSRIVSVEDVRPAAVLKVFRFLPIQEVVAIGAMVPIVLYVPCHVVTDEGIVVVYMVQE